MESLILLGVSDKSGQNPTFENMFFATHHTQDCQIPVSRNFGTPLGRSVLLTVPDGSGAPLVKAKTGETFIRVMV